MANCKGCGKEIIWAETNDGKKIPLDPVPPIYAYNPEDGKYFRTKNVYVTHFATCPKANEFSASRKK